MGKYDQEMRRILGEDVLECILDEVRSNKIDEQKMKDIAFGLDSWAGGSHEKRKKCDDAEMRQILEDWWECGNLNEMTQKEAQQSR